MKRLYYQIAVRVEDGSQGTIADRYKTAEEVEAKVKELRATTVNMRTAGKSIGKLTGQQKPEKGMAL